MIDRIDNAGHFSLEFVTANLTTRKGGQLRTFDNCVKMPSDTPELYATGKKGHGRGHKRVKVENEVLKIHLPLEHSRDERYRTVHLHLITKFNGLTVL